MKIINLEDLDNLSDDELWEAAADVSNNAEIRHDAIQRWLFPEASLTTNDEDEEAGMRIRELRKRATILDPEEIEEDDIEEFDRKGPFFDGQGRLLIEYNGTMYLVESMIDDYEDVA